jgi:dTMP kinase
MPPARLITIEGIDGAGKTTLATGLEVALAQREVKVELLREPGGVRTAERVRDLLKNPRLRIGSRAEALLYAAARAQLVEEAIEPRLAEGVWVLLDRFVDSSLAYQGAGRGLGLEAVEQINEFATRGRRPDRTLWLELDPDTARRRSQARGEPVDRLEREQDEFFDAIHDAYRALWTANQHRIRRIDAAQPPEGVLAEALAALEDLL